MSRQNDPDLLDDSKVYRRIPSWPDNVRWNDDGTPEPTSPNFRDRRNELSVHLVHETTPERMLQGLAGFGLVTMSLGTFREIFAQASVPVAICRDDEDPAFGHVLVCGEVSKAMARRIAKAAVWVEGFWPDRVNEG